MALAAMDSAAFSIVSSSYPSISPPKVHTLKKPLSLKSPLCNLPPLSISQPSGYFHLHAAVETVTVEENPPSTESRRKLFVLNLPWSYSVVDIKNLFGQCGGVADVEIIKQKDGKNRGFAFVTMASGEEAQAAIEKFDSFSLFKLLRETTDKCQQFEQKNCQHFQQALAANKSRSLFKLSPSASIFINGQRAPLFLSVNGWQGSLEVAGRIIKVQFAKRFKRPLPAAPAPPPPPQETRHRLYVSNLAWKVRSNNLRELFLANSNPVSARVIFDSGRSAGYGFVSFATKEEAESAISEFDGKELFGRPIRLKLSEKNSDDSESREEESTVQQPEDSSEDS